MNILYYTLIAFVTTMSSVMSVAKNSDFTFKKVSSWIQGHKEELWHEEHSFEPQGTLTITNKFGSITVKTWAQPKIVIEMNKSAKEKDLSLVKSENTLSQSQATIKSILPPHVSATVDYYIMVPHKTSIKANASGNILIKRPEGSVQALSDEGTVTIKHAINSVNASAKKGSLQVSMQDIPLNSCITLESCDAINLAVPLTTNATIKAKTTHGKIISHHDVTLRPITSKLNSSTWKQLKREIYCSLGNSGNSSINLLSTNGTITLSEY